MDASVPSHTTLSAGPYASIDATTVTKSLIFSSWVAAPSAIASLLSYEVERQIFTQAGHPVNIRLPFGRQFPAAWTTE